MKIHHYMFFAILMILAFGSYASADDVILEGQMGLSVTSVDYSQNLPLTDLTQIIAGLELKLDWEANEYWQMYVQLKNNWNYEINSENPELSVKAQKYYIDLSNRTGTKLRFGKQRLRSGCGVFWNPTDFFNSSTGLVKKEFDEDSVESLLCETYLAGNTIEIMALPIFNENYALGMVAERVAIGYHLSGNMFVSEKHKALGVNLETSAFGVDVYSEAALIVEKGQFIFDGLMGFSYLFDWEHNASLRTEFYHDETGVNSSNNLAIGVNYSPTDKLSTSCNFFYRFTEKGMMFIPTLKYAFNDFWELTMNGLFTAGDKVSYYGNNFIKSTYTLSINRYF